MSGKHPIILIYDELSRPLKAAVVASLLLLATIGGCSLYAVLRAPAPIIDAARNAGQMEHRIERRAFPDDH